MSDIVLGGNSPPYVSPLIKQPAAARKRTDPEDESFEEDQHQKKAQKPATKKRGLSPEEKDRRAAEKLEQRKAKAKAKAAMMTAKIAAKAAAVERRVALDPEAHRVMAREETDLPIDQVVNGNEDEHSDELLAALGHVLKPVASHQPLPKQQLKPVAPVAAVIAPTIAAVVPAKPAALKPVVPAKAATTSGIVGGRVVYTLPDELKPKPIAALKELHETFPEKAALAFKCGRTLMRNNARHVKLTAFRAELQRLDLGVDSTVIDAIASAFYTNHGNYIKRTRKDLFRTFVLEDVQEAAWLTDARATTLAARFLLINSESDVTDAEKLFVINALSEYLSAAEHETVQKALNSAR